MMWEVDEQVNRIQNPKGREKINHDTGSGPERDADAGTVHAA